jgi:hypothetical protein
MNYFATYAKLWIFCLLTVFTVTTLTSTLTIAEITEDAIENRKHAFSKEIFESGMTADQADSRTDFTIALRYYEGKDVAMNLSGNYSE